MTATTAKGWVGRLIDGRYLVEAVVGHGGMGVVLATRHKFTGARVAVKMVRTDLGIDAEIVARFLAEARVPTALDHRGVVKTFDAGKTPEGELYLVMELLHGRSLRDQMTSGVGGPSTRRIGMELLDVLAAAHARGIIHRDVKPENVFLVEPELSVKLLDFGITKLLAGTASVLPGTASGVLLGTLAYMAPEQLVDASTVDARADLWSVGVILYEMLSGRRPHLAATVEEMMFALMKIEPDPIRIAMPSAVPEVEAFFARALARELPQRFATAAEMAMAFARLPVATSAVHVVRPAGGNATLATGFAATTPDQGTRWVAAQAGSQPAPRPSPAPFDAPVPVLTPYAGTPALPGAASMRGGAPLGASPTPSSATPSAPPGWAPVGAPRASVGPAPSPPASWTPRAAPPAPGPAAGIPTMKTSPSPAPTGAVAAAARTSQRRLALALGGIGTLALAAAIVVAVRGTQPTSPPQRHDSQVALPGSGSPPAPSPAPPPEPGPVSPPADPAKPAATPDPTPSPRATPAIAPDPARSPKGVVPAPKVAPAPDHTAPPGHTAPSDRIRTPDRTPSPRASATPDRTPSPGAPATPDRTLSPRAPPSPSPKRPESTQPPPRSGGAQAKVPLPEPAPHAGAPPPPEVGPPNRPDSARPSAPTGPAPAAPAAQALPADLCASGCKMLASCHLGSKTCEADCAKHGTLSTCLQKSANDCNRFAACWFASSCRGVTPSGRRTCSAAMDCEAACNGDTTCLCRCIGSLSLDHAAALLGYNGCALSCRDASCIAQRCGPQTRSCRAE